MFGKKLKKALLAGITVLTLLTASQHAFAYNLFYGTKSGGLMNQAYTRTSYVSDSSQYGYTPWENLIDNAVSDWNDTPAPFWYNYSTDKTYSTMDLYVNNYGNTGWTGQTNFYLWDGYQVDPSYSNYDYTTIWLNNTYCYEANSDLGGMVVHEIGHNNSLAHNGNPYTIMYPDDGRYVTTPQTDDINGVEAKY